MDEDGYAHFAAIENLASRARVTVEETQKAIETFLAPDPNSSNPENDGKRIERVPGGYMILNAMLYRELATKMQQKEQNRARVAMYRAKNQGKRKKTITKHYTPLPSAYAYASAFDSSQGESEGDLPKEIIPPVLADALKWMAFANGNGGDFKELEIKSAFAALKAKGFKWSGVAVSDWKAALERQIYSDRNFNEKYGTNKSNSGQSSGRNKGTYNEDSGKDFKAHMLRQKNKLQDAQRSGSGTDVKGNV